MRFGLEFPVLFDQYASATRVPSWFARTFPSIVFYRQMIGTVFRAASLAKQKRYKDPEWCLSSYEILQAIESIGTKVTISQIGQIRKLKGPCVIVANHMSTLETFLLAYIISPHKKLTFVVKESLVSYPIFKHIMISRDPIVVGRNNPKKDFMVVLNEGKKRLEAGYSVVVFPQTTRMTEFDRSKFNSIGIKLSKRAKVPVVPLALKTDCWGNGVLLKDFGRIDPKKPVHLEFGPPLKIEGNGKDQQEAVVQHIETCLDRWKSET